MFTSEQFVKLCDLPKLSFKTLMHFQPDMRLREPVRLMRVGFDDVIPDPVIWEICYMNGY